MESSPAKNCLCVELDPDFYYLMQSYAQRSKFLTVLTSRDQNIVKTAHEQRPDVILLEADPQLEGVAWQTLHALKADTQTAKIPVVIFSWLAVEEQALSEGADAFVQKPVMYTDFMDALALVGITRASPDLSSERRD